MAAPWEVLSVIPERPPSTLRTSTTVPLGCAAGEFGSAHHQCLENVDNGPLGGAARGSGSTHHQCLENVDGEPPGRCCQRSGSTHYQR
jgi:hypothetical protein